LPASLAVILMRMGNDSGIRCEGYYRASQGMLQLVAFVNKLISVVVRLGQG